MTDNVFGARPWRERPTGDMRQELEWIYICWGVETKELVRDTQKDPVKRSAISRSCSLTVHFFCGELSGGDGDLLTLGYRDPLMDRAPCLLSLMSGPGATERPFGFSQRAWSVSH